jgi:hypothetical protein
VEELLGRQVQVLGCSGSETDIFVVCQDRTGLRFALHIEVKQPTDRFDPAKRQGERYRLRAACWAQEAPTTVPHHTAAATLLICSKTKVDHFAPESAFRRRDHLRILCVEFSSGLARDHAMRARNPSYRTLLERNSLI